MKPYVLKGHERSLTHVMYNKGGDLLFTCSKDSSPNVWFADDGSRLGTYNGHAGTVWNCDVTDDTNFLLTASADQFAKLWKVQTGECLRTYDIGGPARWVALSEGCNDFLVVHDNFKENAGGVPCGIALYRLDRAAAGSEWPIPGDDGSSTEAPYLRIIVDENARKRINSAVWLPLNTHILVAMEDGVLKVFDAKTGEQTTQVVAHPGATITSMAYSHDKTTFVTTSSDATTVLWDTKALTPLVTYQSDAKVNSASIHPDRELILMGGGQEARDVTTTSTGAGKFDARIHHTVHAELLGTLQGHFGPINTAAWSPDGLSFVTGGEDGYVRMHHLKDDWKTWGTLGEEPELDDPKVTEAVGEDWDLQFDEEEGEGSQYDEEGAPASAAGGTTA